MSSYEAETKFESILDNIIEDEITLKHGEDEKTFTLKQLELEVNISDKVYEACRVGRNGNIFENNYKILKVWLDGENLEFDLKYNEDIIKSIFAGLDEEWEGKFKDNSYYIDGEKLIIVRGVEGEIIDEETLRNAINKMVREKIEGRKVSEINIPTITKKPSEIDIETIQKEVYKEAKNAEYDKEKRKLSVHSNGVEFGISIEEAKQIIGEQKQEYIIPLQITMPAVTTDMLGENAFPDVLGSCSTRYDASNKNRGTNIELAANTINGKVLIPGEKFSFNSMVGNTTAAQGYKKAGAYSAGELVESYGGGICQVSSTLYNAVLYANLEVVERYNHSAVVSYLDPGRDATVSYGSRDFKFSNPRKYAIKINAKANNGILEIEIRGIAEADDPEIEIVSQKTDTIPCATKYVYDSTLAEDQEVVKSWGANGAKSITYRIVKKNGREISKTVLSEDSYNPMTKVIRTGSKNMANARNN